MQRVLFLLILFVFIITSCEEYTPCTCNQEWRANTTYKTGDVIKYNGICWEAQMESKGYPPFGFSEIIPNMPKLWVQCY